VWAKEHTLKDDLLTFRRTIGEFKSDKKRAPHSLDELVQARYLRRIPNDPMTGQPNWNPVMEVRPMNKGIQIGIADVHSASDQISTEGTPYSSW
jgi:general secretion pathway protein G